MAPGSTSSPRACLGTVTKLRLERNFTRDLVCFVARRQLRWCTPQTAESRVCGRTGESSLLGGRRAAAKTASKASPEKTLHAESDIPDAPASAPPVFCFQRRHHGAAKRNVKGCRHTWPHERKHVGTTPRGLSLDLELVLRGFEPALGVPSRI